jgi:hypothetical protein
VWPDLIDPLIDRYLREGKLREGKRWTLEAFIEDVRERCQQKTGSAPHRVTVKKRVHKLQRQRRRSRNKEPK